MVLRGYFLQAPSGLDQESRATIALLDGLLEKVDPGNLPCKQGIGREGFEWPFEAEEEFKFVLDCRVKVDKFEREHPNQTKAAQDS